MRAVADIETEPVSSRVRRPPSILLIIAAGVLGAMLLVVGIALTLKWPFTESDFLRDYENRGKPIRVGEGSKEEVRLSVIP